MPPTLQASRLAGEPRSIHVGVTTPQRGNPLPSQLLSSTPSVLTKSPWHSALDKPNHLLMQKIQLTSGGSPRTLSSQQTPVVCLGNAPKMKLPPTANITAAYPKGLTPSLKGSPLLLSSTPGLKTSSLSLKSRTPLLSKTSSPLENCLLKSAEGGRTAIGTVGSLQSPLLTSGFKTSGDEKLLLETKSSLLSPELSKLPGKPDKKLLDTSQTWSKSATLRKSQSKHATKTPAGKSQENSEKKKIRSPTKHKETDEKKAAEKIEVPPPKYELFDELRKEKPVDMPTFLPPGPIYMPETSSKKVALLNAVSSSLICSPNFKDAKNEMRAHLLSVAESVALYDPEFVLKTALYSRRELNIRTPANFLLALAANIKECRVFIKKYFKEAIRLPSDWIDVAELYQAFYDKSINYGSLPAALRRSMVAKFPDFDKYQLAKYNKDKSKSKKKGKPKGGNDRGAGKGKFAAKGRTEKPQELSDSESSDEETESDVKNVSRMISTGEETETEEELEQRTFTLKQLIRKLHITEPVEHVMCLIGKKYPESLEEFYATRIPGTWEEERAGKRMKLPVPITWETQLSLKGNKAATWEQLIDSKKLPYMAMLRNLRNMIKAGISPKHHNWVIKKLCDQGSVIYSKQFPFRFFSAYEILDQLEADYQKNQSDIIEKATKEATGQPTQDRKQMSKLMKAAKSSDGTIKWWLLKKNKKKQGDISEVPFDTRLLNRYRKALDNAVKIATVYNVQPIRGRTVIFCDVSDDMLIPCTAARGLGKPRMLKEVGLLLGLMCKYSCEESELILYDHHRYSSVQVDKGTILDNVNILQHLDLEKDSNAGLSESGFPKAKLTEFLRDRVQIDNLIVLSPGLDCESGFDIPGLGGEKGKQLSDFLLKYRRIVSPDLLFVTIALAGKHGSVDVNTEHPNDISVSGYSDQILRFIAERGSGAQLTHVENIDTAYNLDPKLKVSLDKSSLPTKALKPTKLPRPVETVPVPVWRTVRVFISSTFRDMHGERDILTRFIFPELRARCRRHFIHVLEVDLRWGVTEEDTKRKQAVDICLSEVNKCQFFIGLLGERQGWVPLTSDLPESPSWLREHPEGASVTELEMEAARRKFGDLAEKRAFFYIRQSDFIKAIPQKYRQDFEAEHSVSKRRVDKIKERVRQSGLCVLNGYPCTWGGAVDGKPFAGDLGDFGLSVLTRLWVGIRRMYPEVEVVQNQDEQISELHEAAMEAESSKFIGRKQLLKQCLSTLVENPGSVLLLSGKHGSGKSALTAALREEYIASSQCADQDSVLGYMVGSAPGSTNLTSILRLICADLSHRFSLHAQIPQEYKNLVPKLWELLKLASKQSLSPVVVFIDGVDWMEEAHQPYNMEWLPSTLPRNVQFVLTAVEGGRCHKALLRRGVKEVKVAGLDIMDKPKVVRSILAQHRKALDESAFNNQMKLLLSKREAANPLYLALACEELRVFSVFEKVTSKLRSLPHTAPQLLGEILTRMETDVGVDLVKTSLCILLLSRHGISESELHSLLSMHKIAGKGDNSLEEMVRTKLQPEDFLPPAVFLQLQRALQAFLRPMDSKTETFSLAHIGMEEAVSRRYLAQKSDETKNHLHKLLAGYYWQSADPSGDSRWNGLEEKAFSELPYHLIRGRYFSELETILCDLHFIQKRCQLGQTSQLLEDFSHKELKSAAVQEYRSFVSHQIHILSRYPGLTIQQALNDRPDSAPSLDAEEILNTRQAKQHTGVIRWTNRPEHTDQCRLTISDLPYVVTCVAISPCERFLVCGDSDCSVKLYEVATGKELRTFHGHSNKVTDVSYVGQSRVVSAAKDGMLILWDANTGQKVALLKGHSRSVNSCCSNGNLVASVGWDCNIKIWSAKNGAHIWEFKDIKPVNCVAFHPEDESVVTGGWDTNLKIWDIINRKRKAVLRGHTASVRDAAFSPSGRYIASASLDGEVKLWSALNGSQLGEIRGHNLPINKLQFSPSGKDLITVSDDQKIKVWSGHLGRLLHAMDGEPGPLCVAFCPLGESLAVGYNNGELAVFDVESGMAQFRVQPAKDAVRSITYTPNGQYIVLGAEDASIMVLDSTTGDFVYNMDGHTKAVVCVTAATKALATTSDDFTCCVYKHQSVYQLKTKKNKVVPPVAVLRGHEGSVTSCCFNPDETRLATVSKDMSVRIWDLIGLDLDLIDWEPITIMQACHGDWITDCKWSNIGDFLVTSSNDFTAKVWDLNTGNEKTALTGHTSTIHSLAYKYGCVVTTSSDNTAKVWSHKGTEITTLYGHNDRVIACDLFIKVTEVAPVNIDTEPSWGDIVEEGEKPKKKVDKTAPVKFEEVVVATCSDEGTIRLWKPLQANEKACLTGHSNKVLSLACSKSGTLSTSSADQSVKVWSSEVTADDLIGRHNGEVTCVMPSWDQRFVASCSRDGTLKLWRNEKLLNQNFELCTTIQAHSKSVNAVCFLRDDLLATASDDETIQLWRIHSTDKDLILKRQWLVLNASGPVSCLMYTPDGYLVSGDWTGSLTPWHLNEEMTQLVSPSSSVCEVPGAWIMGLRYRPDYMKSVLSVATDNKLRQWRIREKARGFTLEHWASELVTGDDTTCATDVDAYGNTCFVALSDGNLLKCLVPHSHSEPSKTFQRETKKVHAGSISAVLVTKRLVFTASADCTVKVWTHDLAQVGQFCCPSPVTCLRSSCSDKTKGGDNPNIICGDKLGNVYFLSWLM